MKCPHCNENDHEPTAKYCHVCGAKLPTKVIRVSRNKKSIRNAAKKHQMDSSVFRVALIILIILLVLYGLYYGLSHYWPYISYEYVDKQSENAWENRFLDPNKYDYFLTGEPEPEPKTGSIFVDSSPQGAVIVLDGKKTGKTTPAIIDKITEGKHKVIVKYQGVEISNTWYNIGEENYSILFRFESPYIPIVKH